MVTPFLELPFLKTKKYYEKIKANCMCIISMCKCNGSKGKN